VSELNALLDDYDASADKSCGPEIAQLLLDLGDDWVARALPRDRDAIDLAEQAYRRVLATFTQSQLDAWGICTSLAELRHTRAELLLKNEHWHECALAFDEALAGSTSLDRARDAALGAVVCHHRGWSTWREALGRGPLLWRIEEQIEDTARWRQLLGAYHRFLCLGRGAGDERLGDEVALSRAEAFYQGGALWEAAVGFRVLAFDARRAREGLAAARRYAQVMESLAEDQSCHIQLTRDLERLHARYCNRHNASGCGELGEAVARAGGALGH
jgi:hypothetical protein